MLTYLKAWFYSRRSEKGQDLAEYALLIGLIALIALAAVTLLGQSIRDVLQRIADEITTWF